MTEPTDLAPVYVHDGYCPVCDELGALLVAAGLGQPLEHALISLLALNGLRVSEATGADSSTWAWNAGTGR